jgi:hypothetical protein
MTEKEQKKFHAFGIEGMVHIGYTSPHSMTKITNRIWTKILQ